MSSENISFDPIEIKQYDHKNKKTSKTRKSNLFLKRHWQNWKKIFYVVMPQTKFPCFSLSTDETCH